MGMLGKLGRYYKKLNDYMGILQQSEDAPGKAYLYFDFVRSFICHGSTVADYFQYRFWDKSSVAKKKFMTARRNNRFYRRANELEARGRLNHKATFNQDFDRYLRRPWIAIPAAGEEEFCRFVQENEPVFVKPCHLGAGAGVQKVTAEEIGDFHAFYEGLVKKGEYVVEACVVQHETMAKMHPESTNTVRIMTFFDGADVHVIGAVFRCGRGSAYIDNHSAGGLTAVIDPDTGVICTSGSSKWELNIVKHPDTGVMFPGFQVPYWAEAVETVKEAAKTLKGIHYVGWDVAFMADGVCLIEANPSGDPAMLQEPTQTGVRHLYDWMLSKLP